MNRVIQRIVTSLKTSLAVVLLRLNTVYATHACNKASFCDALTLVELSLSNRCFPRSNKEALRLTTHTAWSGDQAQENAMNTFLVNFLSLLPTLIVGLEKEAADLAGSQKKQAVTDALSAIAQGVAAVPPSNATVAQAAANVATAAIDGVVAIVKPTTAVTAAA